MNDRRPIGLVLLTLLLGPQPVIAAEPGPRCVPAENCSGGDCRRDSCDVYALPACTAEQVYGDDYDRDGWEDDFDNCWRTANLGQDDSDGDAIGDACDNCPNVVNQGQEDVDGDGEGDACDADIDGDGTPNTGDLCQRVAERAQRDTDGDGQGDACDADDDGDEVPDARDNCPLVRNADQTTVTGQVCDGDEDGDGKNDSIDNCRVVANADQADLDADDRGDACDTDADGDDVLDARDNCVGLKNDQRDDDWDGVGDACDDRYCFVPFPGSDRCLDPLEPVKVYAPDDEVEVGEELHLRLFVNRLDLPLRYRWSVVDGPEGARANLRQAAGLAHLMTTAYEYCFAWPPTFSAGVAGVYRLRVEGQPVSDGELSHHELQITVKPAKDTGADNGCALSADGSPRPALCLVGALLGLLFISRRRSNGRRPTSSLRAECRFRVSGSRRRSGRPGPRRAAVRDDRVNRVGGIVITSETAPLAPGFERIRAAHHQEAPR